MVIPEYVLESLSKVIFRPWSQNLGKTSAYNYLNSHSHHLSCITEKDLSKLRHVEEIKGKVLTGQIWWFLVDSYTI